MIFEITGIIAYQFLEFLPKYVFKAHVREPPLASAKFLYFVNRIDTYEKEEYTRAHARTHTDARHLKRSILSSLSEKFLRTANN